MDSNKIIQSLWVGNSLSKMEQLCAKSYLHNGHDFHLYVYDEIKNVPHGVVLKNGNEIISESKIFKDNRGGFASFSDFFRYTLLYKKGGWWVDMDSICLKYFDIKEDYCFSCENGSIVNNGFIKTPSNSEFLQDCLEQIHVIGFKNVMRGSFGPTLISNILKNYDSDSFLKHSEYFCPVNWDEVYRLISIPTYVPKKESYAVHMWNEMWNVYYLNKDVSYHPKSFYELLKAKYGLNS